MTNTLEWLFMGLGSSLTYKSNMDAFHHFENVRNVISLVPGDIEGQMRCHFPVMIWHHKHSGMVLFRVLITT